MLDPQNLHTSSTSLENSSSSNSSRRNSADNISYPELVHSKLEKKRSWRGFHRQYSNEQGFGSVTEEPTEKEDKDEIDQKQLLPHLRMINDYQEFSQKISRSIARGRKDVPREQLYRRRSCSLRNRGLERVEEEIIPEDDEFKNKYVYKLGLMVDKNEFNQRVGRGSLQFSMTKEKTDILSSQPIPEDARENIRDIKEPSAYQIQSPRYKLKVDEVDFKQDPEKKWNKEEQEVIIEEKAEDEQNAKEKQMFSKISNLLDNERDFLKRIVKGEQFSEEDLMRKNQLLQQVGEHQWQQLIQEVDVSSGSSDDDEVGKKRNSKRSL